jgi:hypothetical protein
MTHSFEPREDPDIDSVWRWFEFQLGLIREEQGRILQILAAGRDIGVGPPVAPGSPFIGLAPREVEAFFDEQAGYLELHTMFELLATIEAILRIEFKARVRERRKDDLSRRFREAHREAHKLRGDKIRLDDDILGALKRGRCGGRRLSRNVEPARLACAWQALAPEAWPGLYAGRCTAHRARIDRFDSTVAMVGRTRA